MVGGQILSLIAKIENIASIAPAAPNRWPVIDLVELTTRFLDDFSKTDLIAKVSAMIAVWAAAILVDFSGFVPGTLNSESAMLALRVYYCLGCAAFFLPALFLTWFYPLTKEKHKELREELESQSN